MSRINKLKFVPNRDDCPRNTWTDHAYGWYCAQDPDGSWYWYEYEPKFNVQKNQWEEVTFAFPKRRFYKKTEPEDCVDDTCIYMGTMEHYADLNRRQHEETQRRWEEFYGSRN